MRVTNRTSFRSTRIVHTIFLSRDRTSHSCAVTTPALLLAVHTSPLHSRSWWTSLPSLLSHSVILLFALAPPAVPSLSSSPFRSRSQCTYHPSPIASANVRAHDAHSRRRDGSTSCTQKDSFIGLDAAFSCCADLYAPLLHLSPCDRRMYCFVYRYISLFLRLIIYSVHAAPLPALLTAEMFRACSSTRYTSNRPPTAQSTPHHRPPVVFGPSLLQFTSISHCTANCDARPLFTCGVWRSPSRPRRSNHLLLCIFVSSFQSRIHSTQADFYPCHRYLHALHP
jgi:hypothetical protein